MGNPEWDYRRVDLDRDGAPHTSLRSPARNTGDIASGARALESP